MMDIKSLVPYAKEQMAQGKTLNEVIKDLDLDWNRASLLKYHVHRTEPAIREEDMYTFIPQKVKIVKFVMVNGKRYRDVTENLIDCGG